MIRLKELRRPRFSHESSSDDFAAGFFGLSLRRMMPRLKDARRPRFWRESSSDDFTAGFFGLSGGSFTSTGIDGTEGELGNDVWLGFEPLEMAEVRIDNKGLLAINRWVTLGDDEVLLRRSRIWAYVILQLLRQSDQSNSTTYVMGRGRSRVWGGTFSYYLPQLIS
jgi:hypothetical protein